MNRAMAIAVLPFLFLVSCREEQPITMDLAQENLIPKPVSLTPSGSAFTINAETGVFAGTGGEGATAVAEYLVDLLNPATGFELAVQTAESAPKDNYIFLDLSADDAELGAEGYELDITAGGVIIVANQPAGLFYGVQTLRQLLPPEIELDTPQPGPWLVATGAIRDYPDYAYRGAMLDVARHFFSVDDVKRFIDFLAAYKMNYLHLHLSDDQGWRIEIKSWPNLAEHGGSTEVGGGEGGYYTQEDFAGIVQYAQDRFITIVPEIDMPGHTNAALASYPELNCDGKAPELYTGIEVGFSTLCTDKEVVYKFVDDVVREITALTPGPYFHVGGDESHVTPLEDYIPFINRAQEIVQSHGKQMMGWDEVVNADLDPTSVAQYWAEAEHAQRAVEQGAKVLMSPAVKAYMDMQYDSTSPLGLHWAAYIEIDSAYLWTPEEMVEGVDKDDILGIEAPLWTETITNIDELEYMVFPRLPGYAEIGWTPASMRNWEEYKVRLGKQKARFEAMDIDYYASKLVHWANDGKKTMGGE